ncbi:tetratricopeptide repeat protein [Calidifontibacillus erzurumensis]|uniref:tetratricopeptide repeat protein n=1 Tax=Calidifontibacillus erzurumensis TaxID=2741433 RepID=UPI0035B51A8F
MDKKNKSKKNAGKIIPFPNLEERLLTKGMDALKERRFKEALQIFKQCSSLQPNHPEIEIGIVVCLIELGLYEDAKEQCERLLRENVGDYFYVLQIYMTILIQLSEYDKVVSILEVLFEEEKIPEEHARGLFHLLEFSRKSSDRAAEQKKSQVLSDLDQLSERLNNGTANEQLYVIQQLRKVGSIGHWLDPLKKILANHHSHPVIQSLILQLLSEKEIEEPIVIAKFGRICEVNPITLTNIFEDPFTIQVLNRLEDHLGHVNPTLYEAIKELWELFLFVLYPFPPEPANISLWAGALHKYGYQLFGIDVTNNEIQELYNVKTDMLEEAYGQLLEAEKISTMNLNE